MSAESWVLETFPREVRAEAVDVAATLPRASLAPIGHFAVNIAGEQLSIPSRIYHDELDVQGDDWSPTHRLVADCLYTRHHDGRVRERHALRIVRDLTPWVLPFVVQLVGEYVVEIVAALEERLLDIGTPGSPQQRAYGAFLAANPELLQLTRARVISYWDCYYRRDFPALADYPGLSPDRRVRRGRGDGRRALTAMCTPRSRRTPEQFSAGGAASKRP